MVLWNYEKLGSYLVRCCGNDENSTHAGNNHWSIVYTWYQLQCTVHQEELEAWVVSTFHHKFLQDFSPELLQVLFRNQFRYLSVLKSTWNTDQKEKRQARALSVVNIPVQWTVTDAYKYWLDFLEMRQVDRYKSLGDYNPHYRHKRCIGIWNLAIHTQ